MTGNLVMSLDKYRWFIESDEDYLVLNEGEYTVRKFLREIARPDWVFVDVGAHVGEYAVRLARYYMKVIAIEPNPRAVAKLVKNIKLNNINNIEVIQVACGDVETEMMLRVRGGSSTLLPDIKSDTVVKVKVTRLDNIVEHADVIKIDVEGFEEKVILGAMKLIEKCRPILVIEHHEERGYQQCAGMRERIKKHLRGYIAFNLDFVHWAYVPEGDRLEHVLKTCPDVICWHWFNHCIKMLVEKNCWYYGLPETWWYGAHIIDFYEALKEHIKHESIWLEKIKKGEV